MLPRPPYAAARRVPVGVFILAGALTAACGGAELTGDAEVRLSSRGAGSSSAAKVPYEERVAAIEARRRSFATALAASKCAEQRRSVASEARDFLLSAITDELLPAWAGTPWAMNGTATEPGTEPIACGYFVATILRDAGVPLHRVRFGQAAALRIQAAMSPPQREVHRFFSIPPESLARKIAALGDGLYIIGLNVHVGFVVVRDGEVRFVHSSYTGARVVTDEPFAEAAAIAASQEAGYFVSELFSTDAAILQWVEGRPAKLPP